MDPVLNNLLKYLSNEYVYIVYVTKDYLSTNEPMIYGIYTTLEKAREVLNRLYKQYVNKIRTNDSDFNNILFISKIRLDYDMNDISKGILDHTAREMIEFTII